MTTMRCLTGAGLTHPEDVAVDAQGNVYTGVAAPNHTGRGPILRLTLNGRCQPFADSGGRVLGLAFGPDGHLYACDAANHAIVRIDQDGNVERFVDRVEGRSLITPNYLLFDVHGSLFVSDSGTARANEPTGWVARFGLDGAGEMIRDGLTFANGLALYDGALYVVETRDDRVLRIPLAGSDAGSADVYAAGLTAGPDGIAFDTRGNLLVTLTQTNRIVSVAGDGSVSVIADESNAVLQAPSNLTVVPHNHHRAYVANVLGNCITIVDLPHAGCVADVTPPAWT